MTKRKAILVGWLNSHETGMDELNKHLSEGWTIDSTVQLHGMPGASAAHAIGALVILAEPRA